MPRTSLLEKAIWWLGVDFALATVPLFIHALTGKQGGWDGAIGHGELLLVACGVSAIAIVTAVTSETTAPRLRELRATVVVLGLISLLASGLAYATISTRIAASQSSDVIGPSYGFSAAALIIGFTSLLLTTKVEEAA